MTLRSRFRLAAIALGLALAAGVTLLPRVLGAPSDGGGSSVAIAILVVWVVGAVAILDAMVARFVVAPLESLRAAMRRLAAGSTGTRELVIRHDELGATMEAFNELQQAVDARRREDLAAAGRSLELLHDLRRTETLGFAGKFGSALGHEISTPLNVIAGRIAIARTKLPSSSSARDDLNIVLTQTERIGAMIRTLLEPLRVPPPALAPANVRDLVAPLLGRLGHLAEARSIELVLDVPPETPRILADAGQLTQMLTSLLINAVETAPAGGKVSIRAHTVRADDRAMVELSIHDTGSVIPSHMLARVFDPVFPTKAATNGTSLALSTARDIVRGHSGELSVDSEAGVGTTFTCWLPVIEEDKQ